MRADFDIASALRGDLLDVTFSGQSTSENAAAMTQSYFDIVLASGAKKVLVDIRQLKGRLSGGQTYFLVRNLPVQPAPADIRTAVLDAPENAAYAEFLEDTAANAGVAFRCFLDRPQAFSWLNATDYRGS